MGLGIFRVWDFMGLGTFRVWGFMGLGTLAFGVLWV